MRLMGTRLEQQLQAMTEENRRLTAQRSAQAQAQASASASPVIAPERSPKSQLKAPLLKPFLGVMGFEVDTWLRSVRKQFDFHGASVFPDDKSKIRYAALNLESAALEWWDTMRKEDKEAMTTWEEFVDSLHDRYRPKQAAEVARQNLAALKQTGGVSQLCNKMLQLLAHVPTMHDDDKIFTFKQALDKNLAAKVAEKEPKTLNEAMYIAVQAELYVGRSAGARHAGGFFNNFGNRGGYQGRAAASSSGAAPMELNHVGSAADEDEAFMDSLNLDHPAKATGDQSGASERELQLMAMVQQLQVQQHSLAAAFQKRGGGDRKFGSASGGAKVPGVSKEGFERCRKEGLCLKCKEAGHLARDCTKPVRNLKW